MSNFPDLNRYGYQVIEQLGHNYQGGRFTYKAIELSTQQSVVIKQFRFATGSNWAGYKAVEREIEFLKSLKHPGIPRYLDSFDSNDGMSLVQEYINGQPLSVVRTFEADEVKSIAKCVLEILVYLQRLLPPVIHRDIKPENILIDAWLNVYLVDFGVAKIGGQEIVAASSMVAGTLGFMPPEQLFNRQLTEASDLYGLGVTLICLLTGTKSNQIGDLIDNNFRLDFGRLLPRLNDEFIEWLERMVQPNPQERFENARSALAALKPLDVARSPKVKFSNWTLEFAASQLGEKLTRKLVLDDFLTQMFPDGRWEVAPHSSDPPHTPDSHLWIEFSRAKFSKNLAECTITVDTSKLMADRVYERQILLHDRTGAETHSFNLKVKTAPILKKVPKLPYAYLGCFFMLCYGAGAGMGSDPAPAVTGALSGAFWATLGAIFSVQTNPDWTDWAARGAKSGITVGAIAGSILGASIGEIFGGVTLGAALTGGIVGAAAGAIVGAAAKSVVWAIASPKLLAPCLVGILTGAIVGALQGSIFEFVGATFAIAGGLGFSIGFVIIELLENFFVRRGFKESYAVKLLFLTAGLGVFLGIGSTGVFLNPLLLLALVGTSVPLTKVLVDPFLKRQKLIAKYRQQEQKQYLIQP